MLPWYCEWTLKTRRLGRINLPLIMTQHSPPHSSARRLHFPFCPPRFVLVLAVATVELLSACDRAPGVKTSTAQLEKAFAAPTATGSADAQGYVQTALAAVRSNDYAVAVMMLKAAVRAPGMTPDQFITVQQTKNALLANLRDRAGKGDTRARDALKAIEQAPAD